MYGCRRTFQILAFWVDASKNLEIVPRVSDMRWNLIGAVVYWAPSRFNFPYTLLPAGEALYATLILFT